MTTTKVEKLSQKIIRFINSLKLTAGAYAGQPMELRDWQKKWIEKIYDNPKARTVFISVARKNAKCLDIETPIPTTSGFKLLKDLVIGDLVFGSDGRSYPVLALSEVFTDRECFEITFKDGQKIVCDGGHKWVVDLRARRGPRKKEVLTTFQLIEALKYARKRRQSLPVPINGSLDFPAKKLPFDPWLFGFWLGDGSSYDSRFSHLPKHKSDMLIKRLQKLKIEHSIFGLGDQRKGLTSIYAKKVFTKPKLEKLNLRANKHIPRIFLEASKKQRLELLKGLMDSDGTISKRGQALIISKKFGKDILELVRSLGIKASIRTFKAMGHTYQGVQFFPDKKLKIATSPINPQKKCSDRISRLGIDSIIPVTPRPVKCIAVGSPDHTFLCGKGFLVTHNSEVCGGLALAHLCLKELRLLNQQIYIVACDRAQASIIFEVVKSMIIQDAQLMPLFKIQDTKRQITHRETNGFIQALSAIESSLHGKNPRVVFFDEAGAISAEKGRGMYNVLTSGFGAQKDKSLTFLLSTQAEDDLHFFSELFDYGLQVQKGEIIDPTFVPIIHTIPKELDVFNPKNWHLANPALGDFCSMEDFKKAADMAQKMPSNESAFRRLRCNQRTAKTSSFISAEIYEKNNGAFELKKLKGETCFGGLDLSGKNDISSFVLVFPYSGKKGKIPVLSFNWKPKESLAAHTYRDRAPFDIWAKNGFIKTTPGHTIGFDFMAKEIELLSKLYKIESIFFDRWRIDDMQKEFEELDLDLVLQPCGQGFRDMDPAITFIERLFLEERLLLNKNPVMKYMAANCITISDPAGNRKFDKATSISRIDGIVALAMALRAYEKMDGETGSVYDNDEFKI